MENSSEAIQFTGKCALRPSIKIDVKTISIIDQRAINDRNDITINTSNTNGKPPSVVERTSETTSEIFNNRKKERKSGFSTDVVDIRKPVYGV